MPCGGIYPIGPGSFQASFRDQDTENCKCWHCNKSDPPADHFCDEWDCFLHSTCVREFLKTEEGQLVLQHKHAVLVQEADGTITELAKEGVGVGAVPKSVQSSSLVPEIGAPFKFLQSLVFVEGWESHTPPIPPNSWVTYHRPVSSDPTRHHVWWEHGEDIWNLTLEEKMLADAVEEMASKQVDLPGEGAERR